MPSFAAIDGDAWTCGGKKKLIVLNAHWRIRLDGEKNKRRGGVVKAVWSAPVEWSSLNVSA